MSEVFSLESSLKALLKSSWHSNSILEDHELSHNDLDSFNILSPAETFERLKALILSLLHFKRTSLAEEKSELIRRNEQFENMLQKLEAEVRSHIRVEHQLKLHIENSQMQTEELEIEKNKYIKEIKELTDKIKAFKAKSVFRDSKEYLEKIEVLEGNIAKKNNMIHKLESDFANFKLQSEKPPQQGRSFLKKNARRDAFEDFKGKVEQKNVGLMRVQSLFKQASHSKLKDRNKLIKKSKASENKLMSSLIQNSHSRSISEQTKIYSNGRKTPSH